MPVIAAQSKAAALRSEARILRYGMAPTTVALALAARALLEPILHGDTVFLYFVPAVLISAGIGGVGPGLLATALGLGSAFFVLGSPYTFSTIALGNAVVFAIIGVGVSYVGELLYRS